MTFGIVGLVVGRLLVSLLIENKISGRSVVKMPLLKKMNLFTACLEKFLNTIIKDFECQVLISIIKEIYHVYNAFFIKRPSTNTTDLQVLTEQKVTGMYI
jgi:hypothetical protein